MYKNIKIPLNLFAGKKIHEFLEELFNSDITMYTYRTIHFFFEQGYLEIRIDSDEVDSIIDWIKENLKIDLEKIIVEDYFPEIERFGEEGWTIIEKLFEDCARAAIYIQNHGDKIGEGIGERGNQFREGKIIHCFLNQLGYDSLAEASFHNFQAQSMMLKHIREDEIPIYPMIQPIAIVEKVNKEMLGSGPEFG